MLILGYSFGYGFVEYLSEEDARKAIDTLNGYQIEHKRLKVAYARPNCDETKNTNLYIRNIPINYDEQHLHDLFTQFGEVVQVRILRDQNTTFSRRIGFVIMATKQMAQSAIQSLDNTVPPNGGSEPIFVKYADEEGKKRHGPPGAVGNPRNSINQATFPNSNNYMSQQQNSHGFNFNNPNSFMMNSQNSMSGLTPNPLQNLGKMKTNRNGGHQNRYNPMGGAALNNQVGLANNGTNNGAAGNNYNPWNMAAAAAAAAAAIQQQPYSNFGTPNPLIGNSGFDSLINQIGAGGNGATGAAGGGAGGYGNHHPNMQHGHMQQHFNNSTGANNYLNLNSAQAAAAAMAAAAAAALGNSSSTGNLLDISGNAGGIGGSIGGGMSGGMSGSASLPLDGKQSAANSSGHIIYVYGIGQANESDLYSLFSHCGRILRVNVIKNQKTGQCKGYGFVVFETYDEAYYAVHNMNGYMYNHRPLQV